MADTELDAQSLTHALFSRSNGLPPTFGKSTCEIKCRAPDIVKEDFTRLWRSLGWDSESAFLLDMVMVRCYGRDAVLSMREQALRMVAGIGPDSAQAKQGAL